MDRILILKQIYIVVIFCQRLLGTNNT